jgi:hydroxypyruvate isomerase
MPRFSANLSMLFQEHSFLDRFDAAAQAGFAAVEYVSPYEHPAELVAERLRRNGLTQALFNMPPGDWAAGERGIGALPGREDEFRASVDTAIAYAQALGCGQVNCLAGIVAPPDREAAHRVFVDNLSHAAPRFAEAGVRLLIEPINDTIDIPGFFLTTSRQALAIIDEVGSDNLFLQYDIYHMQVMEGDIARTMERHLDRIAHVQIADNPGRNEPGTGEINFRFLFEHLDRIGYAGWVGAEYRPKAGTTQGLGWFEPFAGKGSAAA